MVNIKRSNKFRLMVMTMVFFTISGWVFALFVLQSGSPAPQQVSQRQNLVTAPPALQKIKASGSNLNFETFFFIMDGGKEKGIWAKYGFEPEWIGKPDRGYEAADFKEAVASGVKIGIGGAASEILLARGQGVPLKIVGWQGGECINCRLLVKGDSPIKNLSDLDGKKVGVQSAVHWSNTWVSFQNVEYSLRMEAVSLGNLTNNVVALKLGQVDAIITSERSVLRLIDSGELREIINAADIAARPWVSTTVWATDDLIEQDPELVRRFVKAVQETMRYLQENPSYATELYMKITNAPRDVAESAAKESTGNYTPNRGGQELVEAVRNHWLYLKQAGVIPANIDLNTDEVVDTRFLP